LTSNELQKIEHLYVLRR